MRCRKCHAELPDEAKFCCVCGAKQAIKVGQKTRGNGQGCAIKRGSTWTAIWTVETYPDYETKKIHQVRRWKGGFRTKRDALLYAANPEPVTESPTLRTYWDGWSSSDMQDLSASKKTAYQIAWGKLASLAAKPMDSLTIGMLQNCVDEKAPTFYPAKDMKVLLSHLFKRAVAEGNARTNLAEFICLPSLEEKEQQPFTELELHKLWQAYDGDRIIGCILLMIYSGMMPGELLGLKCDMVDLEAREIRGAGRKTKKRKDTPIVFPDHIVPILQHLMETSPSHTGYVVGINRDRFYAEYHAALQGAGVRDLPPYSCRHTTATALALGNIAPSVIQEVMRHTKFTTTQRYIHPDTASARAAVNSIGKNGAGLGIPSADS